MFNPNMNLSKSEIYFHYLIYFLPMSIVIGNFFLNLNILLIITFFIITMFKKNFFFSANVNLFFILLLIFIIINTYFSLNIQHSIKGWLGFIKNILLFFSIYFALSNNIFKRNFLKFTFIILIFVLLDTLIQYFFGKDIFGFETGNSHGTRLSGPFGDEYVVGAFIAKFFFISLMYLHINYNKKKFQLYIVLFFSISLLVVFLSQERSAFFIFILASVFYFIFARLNLKIKFYTLAITVLLISTILYNNDSYKNKYYKLTSQQLGISKVPHQYNSYKNFQTDSFWDSRYGAHFLTAIEIFKDNKFTGAGAKNFRKICSLEKYASIDSNYYEDRCNTHPHNIYLEILSELGLFGFILFCLFILFVTVKNFFLYFKNLNNNHDNFLYLNNLCLLTILFFPVQTTGSFFSSFNGVFYWVGLSLVMNNMNFKLFRNFD